MPKRGNPKILRKQKFVVMRISGHNVLWGSLNPCHSNICEKITAVASKEPGCMGSGYFDFSFEEKIIRVYGSNSFSRELDHEEIKRLFKSVFPDYIVTVK